MGSYVIELHELDRAQIALVGGKGAHLGELSQIEGILVPAGFCVTTDAFRRIMADAPAIDDRLDRVSLLSVNDHDGIRSLSAQIRRIIEETAVPDDLATAIDRSIVRLGAGAAYAVRSSATAEDLPTASFAGQQDTYLNVVGPSAILHHVRRCWASLFTERAVTYRLRNGFDQRKLRIAVIVQHMVFPQAAGVLFTADPVTSNRKVAAVEAVLGLGDALVSGRVDADRFRVRGAEVISKAIGTQLFAVRASPGGGTQELPIEPERQGQPALRDAQVVQLAQLGRRIERHFGLPQDIEWCLVDDRFHIVQSRPITTLFPIPATDDQENHVYVSVGHAQMMTDAMKPLGLSFWQLTTPRPMHVAGGRLFVDVAPDLSAHASRVRLLEVMGKSDPLIGNALATILERDEFIPTLRDEGPGSASVGDMPDPIESDPAIVVDLIERSEASLAILKSGIHGRSGAGLLDFILADIQELKRILFDPRSHQVFMGAMEATWWLNDRLQVWLGEKNAADTLTQSIPHNVTSEMGLALLDVADVIRPYPEVVALLQQVEGEDFLDALVPITGGQESRNAIRGYLDKYGMRCVGEIDITRPRWSERPATLLPLLLGNVKNFEPGAGDRRFEQGRQEARKKEQDLLARLRELPEGKQKAEETKQKIDRVRTFMGYREYPKYGMVSRYFVYKQALLEEAGRLVQARVLLEKEDIFYLTVSELHDVVRTNHSDNQLISQRKATFRSYQALTPPRVFTSDGEIVAGAYPRDQLPTGALVGLPVSTGIVEGRARVILDMAEADLEVGDILVTTFTDPSWTPAFVAIAGLVTEVGGVMTHGAVIAREYGVPAVVGVEQATLLIRDRQQIRLDGTNGYVEILPEPPPAGMAEPAPSQVE